MNDIRAAALAAAMGGDIKVIRQNQGAQNDAIAAAQLAAGDADAKAVAAAQDAATIKDQTVSGAAFSNAVDPGPFGGLFLGAKAARSLKAAMAEDALSGPKFAYGISVTVAGGHPNGPSNQRSGQWLMVQKEKFLTTDKTGEIDGAYIVVRQGAKDDAGGILIDAAKVFGSGADTGGLTPMEVSGAKIDPAGTTTHRVHAIPAFMEGLGGITAGNGSGMYLEARAGAIHSGIHVVGRSDLAGAPSFSSVLYAATSRDPASRYFRISGQGEVFLGSPAEQVSLRYVGGTLNFRNTDGSANLMSLNQAGGLGVAGGFYSPGVAGANFKNVAHAVNTVGKYQGLQRYDGAEWVFASGTTPSSPWMKMADPAVVAHQPV